MAEFNAAAWLVDRHVEAGWGERIAVRGTRSLSYAGWRGSVVTSPRRCGVLGCIVTTGWCS